MVCSGGVELVCRAFGLTTGRGTDFFLSPRTYGDYFISLLLLNPQNKFTHSEINKMFLKVLPTVKSKEKKLSLRQLSKSLKQAFSSENKSELHMHDRRET